MSAHDAPGAHPALLTLSLALPLPAPAPLLDQAQAALSPWLAMPFDACRLWHADAVKAGWLPRSMLAERDFARSLAALEGLALGPLARRV